MDEIPSEYRQASESLWADNLSEESRFWVRWLTEDEFADHRVLRLNSRRPVPDSFLQHLDPTRNVYHILDVGSGPASPIGALIDGKHVNLILTDPLANDYASILDKLQMFDVMRPLNVRGEELTTIFPNGYFDIVSCNNALDHCADPMSVIREMTNVCRSGGWLHISSLINVGVLENYHGLHQWNLDVRDDRLIVWNPKCSFDVMASIPEIVEISGPPLMGNPPEMSLWLRVLRGSYA